MRRRLEGGGEKGAWGEGDDEVGEGCGQFAGCVRAGVRDCAFEAGLRLLGSLTCAFAILHCTYTAFSPFHWGHLLAIVFGCGAREFHLPHSCSNGSIY